ncbi:asparagine--tRNA ligase [Sediminispirochaeta smaragdinae]|uniref:Asparagine--tRNA ligase n=1 Tax=Sediminispirochaeta smaragdinae (strain DSM 11293 / JCM 15392 / SEBR 4228) TaxID=573413 RepID=E1R736_SEDSS|nr:asparagine--tRNA ligase [Sediminispirochaeta smaragdinae]ADK81363.1 asparaginyl-tRNA synthetase [Sediminispirochaeta smaragdinae DSM 11293]
MRRTHRIVTILSMAPGERVTVYGWVRTKRDSKNVCFLELSDGSSFRNLQVIVDKAEEEKSPVIDSITTGASVEVTGTLAASPGKNQSIELQADSLKLIGEAPAESYPLQKKRHSFEFLREIAHLRPRTNTFGAVTRVRNQLSWAVHRFFQEQGFIYVHTPLISTSDCEGAGEMFQVTTLPLEKVPLKEGKIDYSQDFFGKRASLTVSGQLEAEIYASAFSDVYTFGPTFRAENSNTTRHLAEFWMIEPEMAFCDLAGNMELAEAFLKNILSSVLEHCSEDMKFFNQWVEKGIIDSLEKVIDTPFTHMSYTEAVQALKTGKTNFEFPVEWGSDLQSEHERFLTETVCKGPVIVTDYPKEIKAFYMKLNDDGKSVAAMDVLVPRLGEIIGGSERESRLSVLEQRIHDTGLNPEEYWWYLDLRRFGTVPHSGFGLGFERLIQYVTGMQNIRDVIPFPRTVGNAAF